MSENPMVIHHLYVHIPFCRHKCGYCDFNAYAGMDRLMPDYVEALERELTAMLDTQNFGRLDTIYFGGGTPSLLPADLMSRLLRFIHQRFDVAPDAEITLEANPGSTDAERLSAWLAGGVNRMSLGVQGFDGKALAVLERRTDAAQAESAYALARKAGMRNINIDLIYAVPYQSLDSWLDTLRRGIALHPDHISTYCLTFEEGTLLWRRRAQGKVPEVESDLQWDQLDAACTRSRTGPARASSRDTTTPTGGAARCTGRARALTPTRPTARARGGAGMSCDPRTTSPTRATSSVRSSTSGRCTRRR